MMIRRILTLGLGTAALVAQALPALPELWHERLATVVAVEYTTETEMERRPAVSYGTVVDDDGLVILPSAAVSARVAPDQLSDWKIYRPGRPITEVATGDYLGQDAYTGWHYVRVAPEGRAGLRPIGDFAGPPGVEPVLAEDLWGIGLRKKDEEFLPYFLQGPVSLVQSLPARFAIALRPVAGPGLPAFNAAGEFVGLGATGFGENYLMFSSRTRGGQPIVLVNSEESAAILLADEILPHVDRVPEDVHGRPRAWLGLDGVEPVDPEVARFLQRESQAMLVISEILEDSPAAAAGLAPRDIIWAVDGEPLPRLKPDRVVAAYLEREISRRRPGEVMQFAVLRGGATEPVEVTATLGSAPPRPTEAPRRYFDRLGVTVRDFVYADAVMRRTSPREARGVVVHFVKPHSPADTAGVGPDDWILQIDGHEAADFDEAVARLEAVEADETRAEFVLLVRRGSETAVLRVKLR